QARPDATVELTDGTRAIHGRRAAQGEEHERLWARWREMGDNVDGYATRRPSGRSEEHTSELQSRVDLVCRLLLEKKNSTQDRTYMKEARSSCAPKRAHSWSDRLVRATVWPMSFRGQ